MSDRDYPPRDSGRDYSSSRDPPPRRAAPANKRVYVGRLAHDCRKDDIDQFFGSFAKIVDARIMSGFAFIEFESVRDAEDVVREYNGRNFLGERILVEFAKSPRYREDDVRPRGPGSGFRIEVSGLSSEVSWQDLKDFARGAGNVIFADLVRDRPGEGIIEYASKYDVEEAMRKLDGDTYKGSRVKLYPVEGSGGNGDSGYGGGRGRSRSPPPRRDRERERSPRRGGRDDDRGYGGRGRDDFGRDRDGGRDDRERDGGREDRYSSRD
ncbi:hypothetical protein BT69DRAFT_1271229 [Atractiella rhizophila]|nr:hypothetical protein BT69DRAFT_1271229 [Atractiella rhizophila]